MTLLELLIVVTLIGILATLGTDAYIAALEDARVTRAITDIRAIEKIMLNYETENGGLPSSLADAAWDRLDPWGNPYGYLSFAAAGAGWKGQARKDRFLVPLNTNYDLYSKGPDGDSQLPLTAAASLDDIVRAGDGGFVGPAAEF